MTLDEALSHMLGHPLAQEEFDLTAIQLRADPGKTRYFPSGSKEAVPDSPGDPQFRRC